MRTKSQGNEVILSTFNHPTLNKNNTTTHQIQIVKIQNQKSIKLSYNIYYKTHSQLSIVYEHMFSSSCNRDGHQKFKPVQQ